MDKIIETKQGKIKGVIHSVAAELSEKKCVQFNAIPFAKCERLAKPVAFGPWEGVLDGTTTTPRQIQYNTLVETGHKVAGITMIPENYKEEFNKAETHDGVLYLQLCTPEDFEKTAKKPVMVWIHGGGWGIGGAHEYTGHSMCTSGDVVFVAITYRLAALGFYGGNWGMWDQLEALKWVKENISAFGGDPDNVTIFGESAGGWSVEALMSSPHAKGFFHKGIAQSGCLKNYYLENDAAYEATVANTKKHFGCDDLEAKLKSATEDEFVELYKELQKTMGAYMARSASDDFFEANIKELEQFPSKVPLMSGMNSTEFGCLFSTLGAEMVPGMEGFSTGWSEEQFLNFNKMMFQMTGADPELVKPWAEKLKAAYSKGRDMSGKMEYTRLHGLYQGDLTFLGCIERSQQICEQQTVFHYQLNVQTKAFHCEPYKNGNDLVRLDYCRSDHGDDLMYMMGTMFLPNATFRLAQGRYFSDDEKALSKRMMKAWTDFARNGNPGWEAFNNDSKVIMQFDTPKDAFISANEEEWQLKLDLWRSTTFPAAQ